jgi:TatD DNase family protein
MIDVHAHLCFPDFDSNREEVVRRCRKEIDGVVVASARYDEGVKTLELAGRHKGFLFPTLGYHPTEGTDYKGVIQLIKNNPEIVGIGEVGLDYHWEKKLEKRNEQKRIFEEFIALAKKLKKPLVLHCWDAEWDTFDMLRGSGLKCLFHCFSGPTELAKQILDDGMEISMSTHVMFSKHHRKLAKLIPLNHILLETDSPFLGPGNEMNYPWNIKLSAEKIAKIKGVSKEEVLGHAKRNAVKFFGLKLARKSG